MQDKNGFSWGSLIFRIVAWTVAGPILGEAVAQAGDFIGAAIEAIDLDAVGQLNEWG